MNIFILDSDFKLCAQYHNNSHVIKMILESTQLLNNGMIHYDPSYVPVYKPTHKNHPCSVWVRESPANFRWLLDLAFALCDEYTYRYGKVHKCQAILDKFKLSSPVGGKLTPFKLCMPDDYRSPDAVASYRAYYRGGKAHIAKWKKREVPAWWSE